MENEQEQPKPTVKGTSRARRITLGIILGLVSLFVLLPLVLYIPFVQNLICQTVLTALNEKDDELQYSIGSIHIGFPLQLQVRDVSVSRKSGGDPLVSVGLLETGLDDIPINQPFFVVNRLHAERVTIGMDSLTEGFGIAGKLAELDLKHVEYDPASNQVHLREAILDRPDVQLYMGPTPPDSIDEPTPEWYVNVNRLVVKEGHLGLDMSPNSLTEAQLRQTLTPYLDYNHLDMNSISLEAESLHYDPVEMRVRVNQFAAVESHSGLEVKQLGVDFKMEGQRVEAKEIDLALAEDDYLRGELALDLTLFDSIASGQAQADLKGRLDSANLIRLATPYVSSLPTYWPNAYAQVEVQGFLTPDSLDLPRLSLYIPDHADIAIEGVGQHISDDQQRSAAATFKGSLQDADFLLSAFVTEPSKRAYRLPKDVMVDAEASQRGDRLAARLDLQQQSVDVLSADVNYDLKTEAYHLEGRTHGFCLSQFLPDLVADRMTARVKADGRHFRFPHRYTRLEAQMQIDTLFYQDPDGRPDSLCMVAAEASLLQGHYAVTVNSQHPYLQANVALAGTWLPDSVSTSGRLDVPVLDLANLPYGLSSPDQGTLSFSSDISAFYNGSDIAQLHITLDSLTYQNNNLEERFDDILVHAESEPGVLDFDVSGGDANITISSDCGLQDLPGVIDSLLTEVNRQREMLKPDFVALQRRLPQMSVDLHMAQKNPFYKALEYRTGVSFQSVDLRVLNAYRLSLDGQILACTTPDGTIDFDTVAIDLHPVTLPQESYLYAVHATHIDPKARKSYDIHTTGHIMPDSLTVGLTYINGNYLTIYDVMASVALAEDSVTLHLEKDPTLYEQPFTVNRDNYFSVMNYRQMEGKHFNTRGRIKLQGPRDLMLNLYTRQNPKNEFGNQMFFMVRNLDLDYATRLMEWEGDAGGRFNLSSSVNLFADSLHATIRSGIRDFHLADYHADTLAFTGVADMAHNLRNMEGKLTVDSIVKLNIDAHLADSINVHGWIDELPLPLLNAFLPSYMQLRGTTTGYLDMKGKDMEQAKVNASLTMQDAGLNYNDLDADIRFGTDTIRLNNNRLQLNNFPLYAANKQAARINGQVDFRKSVSNPSINLQIQGNNIWLIDNKKLRLPNQYIYGRLPISPNIKVKGTLARLKVSGSLNLQSGANLNYFMSDDPLQSSSRVDQIVEFVSFRQIDREMAQSTKKRRPPVQDQVDEGLDIGLKIEIPADAKISAHLAGTDKNRVDIVGGGSLNLQTDNEGNLIMNGVYDITSGKVDYKLPILPMVKTFSILNTSQVYWSANDPTDPVIDIKAVEEVKTTVNDANGSRIVKFLVTISISGTLDVLNMTFDCDAPEDGAISSEIASLDVEERSKTAMMLLVAQTYLGPSTTSSVGLGTANAALNSMLNREMDSMLGNKLKGTNIDLGIDTYSTEAGNARTNYSVKVSQQLFNDRFRATIGGQISSGGDVGQSQGAKLGDMSLEWLIKKDGSHYMKLFRRTNYESVLEGELIETGISYIQERSGYRFRTLLFPSSKKRQQRIQEIIDALKAKEEAELKAEEETRGEM